MSRTLEQNTTPKNTDQKSKKINLGELRPGETFGEINLGDIINNRIIIKKDPPTNTDEETKD